MSNLRLTSMLFIVMAACLGDSLTTSSVATAQAYLFTKSSGVDNVLSFASGLAKTGEFCFDSDDGEAEYLLTLTAPQLAAIQSAAAAAVPIKVTWQTRVTLSPNGGTATVGEQVTFYGPKYIKPLPPRELTIHGYPDTGIDFTNSSGYDIPPGTALNLQVGQTFKVKFSAYTSAVVQGDPCQEDIMGVSAEWEIYNYPRLEILY